MTKMTIQKLNKLINNNEFVTIDAMLFGESDKYIRNIYLKLDTYKHLQEIKRKGTLNFKPFSLFG